MEQNVFSNRNAKDFLICTKCFRKLPATHEYFSKSNRTKIGLRSVCKECIKISTSIYREKNKETILKKNKIYRDNHKSESSIYRKHYYEKNKEKISLYHKDRYIKNKDTILKRTKNYYQSNREKYRQNYKIYRENNKESESLRISLWAKNNKNKVVMRTQRRRAKERKLLNTLTSSEWDNIKSKFNNECAYCGKLSKKLTQDHIIPVSKGGAYVKQNIIPSCKSCNSSKRDEDLDIWYRKQPFFSQQRLDKIYSWMGVKKDKQQLKFI